MMAHYGIVLIAGIGIVSVRGFLLDTKTPSSTSVPRDGVSFNGRQMVRMRFDEKQGFPATDFMYMRVGFITKKKKGILLQVRDETNLEYFSLEMSNNGGLKFFIDIGVERWQVNTDNMDYSDGLAHEVIILRSYGGRIVNIQVTTEGADATRSKEDSSATSSEWLPEHLGTVGNFSLLDRPHYLYIGGNDSQWDGLDGCITHVQIDNMYPLQKAFEVPRPSYVELFTGNDNATTMLRSNTCGCVTVLPDFTLPPPQSERDAMRIPLSLQSDMMVRYEFNKTLEYIYYDFDHLIDIDFITDHRQGTLMKIWGSNDSYLSLEINDHGGVTVHFLDGSYQYRLDSVRDVDLADGKPHSVLLYRPGQTQISINADNKQVFDMLDCRIQTWLEERKNNLYIGNTESVDGETGFEGCIYRLRVGYHDYINALDNKELYGTVEDAIRNGTDWTDNTVSQYIRTICGMESHSNATDIMN